MHRLSPAPFRRYAVAAIVGGITAACEAATAPGAGGTFQLTTDRAAYTPGDTATALLRTAGREFVRYSHCPVFLDRQDPGGAWVAVAAPDAARDVVCTLEIPASQPGVTFPLRRVRIPAAAAGTYRIRFEGVFGPVSAPERAGAYSTPPFQVGTPPR